MIIIYRESQEEMSVFWEVIVSVILSKKMYMCMCPIPNGINTGLFISPSGISELDCATTKTDTAERSISRSI